MPPSPAAATVLAPTVSPSSSRPFFATATTTKTMAPSRRKTPWRPVQPDEAPTEAIMASKTAKTSHPQGEEPTWFAALTTYFSYALLILFGHVRDFFGKVTGHSRYFGGNHGAAVAMQKGLAPLLKDWENFYTRRLYHRIQDCWARPLRGPPLAGAIQVIDRASDDNNCTLRVTDSVTECMNLGSYNYLGFADDWHETCREDVMDSVNRFAMSTCSPAAETGYTVLHRKLEAMVAKFVGKPDAVIFNMGYGTNISAIPAMMGRGTLIISDALNHTSIVNGSRSSGGTVRVFRHNDVGHLERLLRSAIVEGQPGTQRPWRKIVVMVEGIYSMEGEVANLPGIVSICKRYKAYLYVDEAHSIGALGEYGRGVCEHCGIDPADVDVLMGTFTKSFGAMGGYIAGSKEFCAYLRQHSSGSVYTNSMTPVVCQQIIAAFRVIAGLDGTDIGARKLRAVKDNSNYFRKRLQETGAETLGDWDSPIIPLLLYHPAKIAAFGRECKARGLAAVVVGFPATQLTLSRARFCISAGHSKSDLDKAAEKIAEVCRVMKLRYQFSSYG